MEGDEQESMLGSQGGDDTPLEKLLKSKGLTPPAAATVEGEPVAGPEASESPLATLIASRGGTVAGVPETGPQAAARLHTEKFGRRPSEVITETDPTGKSSNVTIGRPLQGVQRIARTLTEAGDAETLEHMQDDPRLSTQIDMQLGMAKARNGERVRLKAPGASFGETATHLALNGIAEALFLGRAVGDDDQRRLDAWAKNGGDPTEVIVPAAPGSFDPGQLRMTPGRPAITRADLLAFAGTGGFLAGAAMTGKAMGAEEGPRSTGLIAAVGGESAPAGQIGTQLYRRGAARVAQAVAEDGGAAAPVLRTAMAQVPTRLTASAATRAGAVAALEDVARELQVEPSQVHKLFDRVMRGFERRARPLAIDVAEGAAVQGATAGTLAGAGAVVSGETDPEAILTDMAKAGAQWGILSGALGTLSSEAQYQAAYHTIFDALAKNPSVAAELRTAQVDQAASAQLADGTMVRRSKNADFVDPATRGPAPAPAPAPVGDGAAPAQAGTPPAKKPRLERPKIQEGSRYEGDDNPGSLHAASKDVLRQQLTTLDQIDAALAHPSVTGKTKEQLQERRAQVATDIEGTTQEITDAFGHEVASRMLQEITPARSPVLPDRTEFQQQLDSHIPKHIAELSDDELISAAHDRAEFVAKANADLSYMKDRDPRRKELQAQLRAGEQEGTHTLTELGRRGLLKPAKTDGTNRTVDQLPPRPKAAPRMERIAPPSRYADIPAVIEAAGDDELASERAKLNEWIDEQRSAIDDTNPKRGGARKKATRAAIEEAENREALYALEQERRAAKVQPAAATPAKAPSGKLPESAMVNGPRVDHFGSHYGYAKRTIEALPEPEDLPAIESEIARLEKEYAPFQKREEQLNSQKKGPKKVEEARIEELASIEEQTADIVNQLEVLRRRQQMVVLPAPEPNDMAGWNEYAKRTEEMESIARGASWSISENNERRDTGDEAEAVRENMRKAQERADEARRIMESAPIYHPWATAPLAQAEREAEAHYKHSVASAGGESKRLKSHDPLEGLSHEAIRMAPAWWSGINRLPGLNSAIESYRRFLKGDTSGQMVDGTPRAESYQRSLDKNIAEREQLLKEIEKGRTEYIADLKARGIPLVAKAATAPASEPEEKKKPRLERKANPKTPFQARLKAILQEMDRDPGKIVSDIDPTYYDDLRKAFPNDPTVHGELVTAIRKEMPAPERAEEPEEESEPAPRLKTKAGKKDPNAGVLEAMARDEEPVPPERWEAEVQRRAIEWWDHQGPLDWTKEMAHEFDVPNKRTKDLSPADVATIVEQWRTKIDPFLPAGGKMRKPGEEPETREAHIARLRAEVDRLREEHGALARAGDPYGAIKLAAQMYRLEDWIDQRSPVVSKRDINGTRKQGPNPLLQAERERKKAEAAFDVWEDPRTKPYMDAREKYEDAILALPGHHRGRFGGDIEKLHDASRALLEKLSPEDRRATTRAWREFAGDNVEDSTPHQGAGGHAEGTPREQMDAEWERAKQQRGRADTEMRAAAALNGETMEEFNRLAPGSFRRAGTTPGRKAEHEASRLKRPHPTSPGRNADGSYITSDDLPRLSPDAATNEQIRTAPPEALRQLLAEIPAARAKLEAEAAGTQGMRRVQFRVEGQLSGVAHREKLATETLAEWEKLEGAGKKPPKKKGAPGTPKPKYDKVPLGELYGELAALQAKIDAVSGHAGMQTIIHNTSTDDTWSAGTLAGGMAAQNTRAWVARINEIEQRLKDADISEDDILAARFDAEYAAELAAEAGTGADDFDFPPGSPHTPQTDDDNDDGSDGSAPAAHGGGSAPVGGGGAAGGAPRLARPGGGGEPKPLDTQGAPRKAGGDPELRAGEAPRLAAPKGVQKTLEEEGQGASEAEVIALLDAAEVKMRESNSFGPGTSSKTLRAWAAGVLGRPYESRTWTMDDVYDAIEGAANRIARKFIGYATDAKGPEIATARRIEDSYFGTRLRTEGMLARQQFSTPIPIALAAQMAAGVEPGEKVLEPTAGTGNLVNLLRDTGTTFKSLGLTIDTNELELRRRAVLKALRFQPTAEDALRLPLNGKKYHVVITNPPYGHIKTGKYSGYGATPFESTDIAQRFIAAAMTELAAGGRLVAVMPPSTLAAAGAAFRGWIAQHYTPVAYIESPEGAYSGRGTDIGTVLMVVDNVPARAGHEPFILRAPDWETWSKAILRFRPGGDLARTLGRGPIADAAPVRVPAPRLKGPKTEAPLVTGTGNAQTTTQEPSRDADAQPVAGADPAAAPRLRRPSDVGGVAAPVPGVRSEGPAPEPGAGDSARGERRAGVVAPEGPGDAGTADAAGPPALVPDLSGGRVDAGASRAGEPGGELEAARRSPVFAPYALGVRERRSPHPRLVVETRAMAGMPAPAITVTHTSPLVDRAWGRSGATGGISDEQMDAVHRTLTAWKNGHGTIVADDVGVGKTREAAALVLEAIQQGHTRILVTTKNENNVADAMAEFKLVASGVEGGDFPALFVNVGDYKGVKSGNDSLPMPKGPVVYFAQSYNFANYAEALAEVEPTTWIADEAHEYKNQFSSRGIAWRFLHGEMAKRKAAQLAYFTATPAVTLDELGYLYGLKEWSLGGFADWVDMKLGKKSVAEFKKGEAEAVAAAEASGKDVREMGDRSEDTSNLHADDKDIAEGKKKPKIRMERPDVFSSKVTPAETEQVMRELKGAGKYLARDLWRGGVKFDVVEVDLLGDSPAARAARARYDTAAALTRDISLAARKFGRMNQKIKTSGLDRALIQSYLKQLLFSLRLPDVLDEAEASLRRGQQVVISLHSVSGDADNEEGLSEEDAEIPLNERLRSAISRINTREIKKNEEAADGYDDLGEIPEALMAVSGLLDRLGKLPPLLDPVRAIEQRFGAQKVAVITGQRTAKQRKLAMGEFQSGQRKLSVISKAGKVGISLHDVNGAQRRMLVADYEWSADTFKQELGRVDRTGQLSNPHVSLFASNLAGERKFAATIAARMASLGATSKGSAESTGTDALDQFDVSDGIALTAMRETVTQLDDAARAYFTGSKFLEVKRTAEGTWVLVPKRVPDEAGMKDFLLEMMMFPAEAANRIWAAWVINRDGLRTGEYEEKQAARRTGRGKGEVLRRTLLTAAGDPPLSMVDMRNEAGERHSVLQGFITPYIKDIQDARQAGGTAGMFATRRYVHVTTNDGELVSGLDLNTAEARRVKGAFGKDERKTISPAEAWDDLQANESVLVAGPGGAKWQLHVRRDGRIQINGATLAKHREDLQGYAKYETVGNYLFLPGEQAHVLRFFDRFPPKLPEKSIGTNTPPTTVGEDFGDLFGELAPAPKPSKADQGSLFGAQAGTEASRPLKSAEQAARTELDKLKAEVKLARLATPEQLRARAARIAELEKLVNRGEKIGADELFYRAVADPTNEVREAAVRFGAAAAFYSRLERQIAAGPNKGTGQQWLAHIAKGVAKGEIEWTGLNRWLEERKHGGLTKAEVAAQAAARRVVIQRVELSDANAHTVTNAITWEETAERRAWYGSTRLGNHTASWTIQYMPSNGLFRLTTMGGGTHSYPMLNVAKDAAQAEADNATRRTVQAPKFKGYTEPGGDNYREVLLTLPSQAATFDPAQLRIERRERSVTQGEFTAYYEGAVLMEGTLSRPSASQVPFGASLHLFSNEELTELARAKVEGAGGWESYRAQDFRSTHWDQPNVLVHFRLTDRTLPDGTKVLHVEEIQSDWHQKGRGKVDPKTKLRVPTYETPLKKEKRAELAKRLEQIDNELARARRHREAAMTAITAEPHAYDLERVFDRQQRQLQEWINAKARARLGFLPAEVIADHERKVQEDEEAVARAQRVLAERRAVLDAMPQAELQRYRDDAQRLLDEMTALTKERAEVKEQIGGYPGLVPDAPYKATDEWVTLALKHIIDEAVRGGFDRVVWTPGQKQGDRYDLSKKVDYIEYNPATAKFAASQRGELVHEGTYDPRALPDVVGKDIAEKLLAQPLDHDMGDAPVHVLRGTALRVEATGMIQFYDKMLPKLVREYTTKIGAPVEVDSVRLGADLRATRWEGPDGAAVRSNDVARVSEYASEDGRTHVSQQLREIAEHMAINDVSLDEAVAATDGEEMDSDVLNLLDAHFGAGKWVVYEHNDGADGGEGHLRSRFFTKEDAEAYVHSEWIPGESGYFSIEHDPHARDDTLEAEEPLGLWVIADDYEAPVDAGYMLERAAELEDESRNTRGAGWIARSDRMRRVADALREVAERMIAGVDITNAMEGLPEDVRVEVAEDQGLRYLTPEQAEHLIPEHRQLGSTPFPSFKVTDALREHVLTQGQTVYEQTARYSPVPLPDVAALERAEVERAHGSAEVAGANAAQLAHDAPFVTRLRANGLPVSEDRIRAVNAADLRALVPLTGQRLTTRAALAQMLHAFRSPKMERGHVFFHNKDGQILSHQLFTSGSMVFVKLDNDYVQHMAEEAQKLGATHITFAHNHPSGDPTSSELDRKFTAYLGFQLQLRGLTLAGHIIIDHDQFSWLMPDPNGGISEEVRPFDLPADAGEDWSAPTLRKTTNMDLIAHSRRVLTEPESGAMFFLDPRHQIIAVEPFTLKRPQSELFALIPERVRAHAAWQVALGVNSIYSAKELARLIGSRQKEDGQLNEVLEVVGVSPLRPGEFYSAASLGHVRGNRRGDSDATMAPFGTRVFDDIEEFNAAVPAVVSGQRTTAALPLPRPAGLQHERSRLRLSEMKDDLLRFLNPEALDRDSRGTAGTIRHETAISYRKLAIAEEALKALRKKVARMPRAEQVRVWDAAETGESTGDADLDAAIEVFHNITEGYTEQLITTGRLNGTAAMEHYIGRFWSVEKDPKARAWLQTLLGKRPLEGPKSFLKHRSLERFTDGLAAGLRPATYNFVDAQLAKLAEMQRLLAADRMLAYELGMGRAKRVLDTSLGKKPPIDGNGEPWVRIDPSEKDAAFIIYGPRRGAVKVPRSGEAKVNGKVIASFEIPEELHGAVDSTTEVYGKRIMGHWYAPRASAAVWGAHLSRGLRGKAWYDALTWPGQAAARLILGLSGFHATVIATEGTISDLALAIDAGVNAKAPRREALKNLGQALTSPVRTARIGARALREYRKPGEEPSFARPLEMVLAGGFRVGGEAVEFWQGERVTRLARHWRTMFEEEASRAEKAGAAVRLPFDALFGFLEIAAWPILGYYVPRMKAGAAIALASRQLEKMGDRGTDLEAVRRVMGDVMHEIDYRFGQVVYDNHFMDRRAKDIAQLMFLAPGWTFGTLALMTRGVADLGARAGTKGVRLAVKRALGGGGGAAGGGGGGGAAGGGAVVPSGGAGQGPPPDVPPELIGKSGAYWIGGVIITMLLNGIITYFSTGEEPEGMDYFAFRDGTKDESGNWNRHTIPGYLMHDVWGWTHHPVNTFLHKLSPALSFFARYTQNRTYFGDMIYDPDAPLATRAGQSARELGRSLTPISISNARESKDRGESGIGEKLRNAAGIGPAKREVQRTPAQNLMAEYLSRRGHTSRTPDEMERGESSQQVRAGVRAGTISSDSATRLVKAGIITKAQKSKALSDAKKHPLLLKYRMLSPEQAVRVYALTEPWEKEILRREYEVKKKRVKAALP